MLPPPSLGPPWLSASPSPAPGPCGMPFLVELVAELAPEEVVLVVVAAAPEDPDPLDEGVVELEELEPQAASARATRTSARGASRRIDMRVFEFMNLLLRVCDCWTCHFPRLGASCSIQLDAPMRTVIPAPYRSLRAREENAARGVCHCRYPKRPREAFVRRTTGIALLILGSMFAAACGSSSSSSSSPGAPSSGSAV